MDNKLNLFDALPTKGNASLIAKQIIESDLSPLELATKISFMEKCLDEAKKGIKEDVLEEMYKYAKAEKISSLGASLEIFEAGTKYSFENCNHPHLADLEQQVADIKVFLKALKESMTIINESTGEIITIHPPIKTSTTSYKVTLAR